MQSGQVKGGRTRRRCFADAATLPAPHALPDCIPIEPEAVSALAAEVNRPVLAQLPIAFGEKVTGKPLAE
jgi:hypothetical protein